MPSPPVTAQGILEVLTLPEQTDRDLEPCVASACSRLQELIGDTNYAALLADTLSERAQDACVRAGQLLGAAYYYRLRIPPVGSRAILSSTTSPDGTTNSHATSEDVAKAARGLRTRAIEEIKRVGLYQRPATSVGTLLIVDPEDA